MEYVVSAWTDIGIRKQTNQDSLAVKKINTSIGKVAFAVLCDGMGGLSNGELASAEVVFAFENWIRNTFPEMCRSQFNDADIRMHWENIIQNMNLKIMCYAGRRGVNMGTTVVAALITPHRYYIMNVGDSRAYEISSQVKRITNDHTVVAQKVRMGKLTEEEALRDPQRNVLLQCVGASDEVVPEFYFGDVCADASYLLCSDGMIHEISTQEVLACFSPYNSNSKEEITNNLQSAVELVKSRGETDNISAVLIRTI